HRLRPHASPTRRSADLAAGRAERSQPHRNAHQRKAPQRLTARTHGTWRDYRNRHPSHAQTSTLAIASEGRFRACEKPDRAASPWASRSDAAIARSARRREGPQGPTAKGTAINTA